MVAARLYLALALGRLETLSVCGSPSSGGSSTTFFGSVEERDSPPPAILFCRSETLFASPQSRKRKEKEEEEEEEEEEGEETIRLPLKKRRSSAPRGEGGSLDSR
jgi:hypothetical protein